MPHVASSTAFQAGTGVGVTSFPDQSTLLALGEICVTLLGFVGVVLVLGRRSAGEWDALEQARFTVMLNGSIGALVLALLPIVLPAEAAYRCAVALCGVSAYLVCRGGVFALRTPGASKLLAVPLMTFAVVLFFVMGLADLGVGIVAMGDLYLIAILWHVGNGILFFVRLINVRKFAD